MSSIELLSPPSGRIRHNDVESSSQGLIARNATAKGGEAQPDTSKSARLWSVPIQMLTFIFVGFAGALAHYLYYRSLTGKAVDAPSKVSQEWNIRIGTGLAFIAKTSWTLAILTSQVQHAWAIIERKRLRPQDIDAIFLAPTDMISLFRVKLFGTAPIAMALAFLAWAIPISAIVTPSTLTVVSQSSTNVVAGTAPRVAFADYPRWARMHATGSYPECLIQYRQGGMCNTTQTTKKTNLMLYENPSPQIATHVVASATSGRIEVFTHEYVNSTLAFDFYGPSIRCRNETKRRDDFKLIKGLSLGSEQRYQAFIPVLNKTGQIVPYERNGTRRLANGLELWMITNSGVFATDEQKYRVKGAYICTMYNATYKVNATFRNGEQFLDTQVETTEPVKWQAASKVRNPFIFDEPDLGHPPLPVVYDTNVQRFAYQGIWLGLMDQLSEESSIQRTRVIGAKEFAGDFQNMDSYNIRGYGGGNQPFKSDKTITELIEQLSDNVTLSLLATEAFLEADGLPTNITVFEIANVYAFNQKALFLSYGLGLLFTVTAAILGFIAYHRNGGSRSFAYSALVESFQVDRLETRPPNLPPKHNGYRPVHSNETS